MRTSGPLAPFGSVRDSGRLLPSNVVRLLVRLDDAFGVEPVNQNQRAAPLVVVVLLLRAFRTGIALQHGPSRCRRTQQLERP